MMELYLHFTIRLRGFVLKHRDKFSFALQMFYGYHGNEMRLR
jgi:hypothetical protein